MTDTVAAGGTATISLDVVQTLLDVLAADRYEVIGPTVRDGAIVYDGIARLADLPAGWTDRQEAGRYRLERRDDDALFGFAVGPHSWKRFLHPPVETLWTARGARTASPSRAAKHRGPNFAFIGVRACELHAIAIQDRVLSRRPLSGYWPMGCAGRMPSSSRSIAGRPAEPVSASRCRPDRRPTAGFDLALTELLDGDDHEFLVEVGSEAGADIARQICRTARPPMPILRPPRRWSRARRTDGPARWTRTGSRNCCRAIPTIRAGTRSPSAA